MAQGDPIPWLALVGIGEDGFLSPAARTALDAAEVVYGGVRHLRLGAPFPGEARPWPSPMADAFPGLLARRDRPTAVLASGDPMWFGVGATLARLLPWADIACHPAPSALTLACARLGWAAENVGVVSLCGRPVETLVDRLRPGRRTIVLSADEHTPAAVLALLRDHGFGDTGVHLLEALGGPHERVRTVAGAVPGDIDRLNLLALEVRGPHRARTVLPDAAFSHDGQITKQEVRAATLAALRSGGGETLWDVGAGSGSVGIEWLRADWANAAIAVERRPDRAARAAANARALGVPRLQVVNGTAPDALAGLPTPDAVFVGGGAAGALDACWSALPPGGRLVANAVTVETEALLVDRRARWGGTLTRLAVERLEPVGGFHAFRPAMTVTQYAGEKP